MTPKKFYTLIIVLVFTAVLGRFLIKTPVSVFTWTHIPTVVVDPGHGKYDPGVVHSESGVQEGPINLSVAYKLKDLLTQEKMRVLLTRDKTTQELKSNRQELERRVKVATDARADIYVSLHVNQFPDPQYFGAQCFYYPLNPGSEKLARLIQEELKAIEPTNTREALPKDLLVLRECSMPSVVVEMGFISHPGDRAKLQDPKHQDTIARAVSLGINRYLQGDELRNPPTYN